MWNIETFYEICISLNSQSVIKKIPISSILTDIDSTLIYTDIVIKTDNFWINDRHALICSFLIPYNINDISSIIKKKIKYQVLTLCKKN
jgi:hypothetical protein